MTLSILQDGSVQEQRRNGMVMFTIRSSADGNVHKVVRGVESSTLSRDHVHEAWSTPHVIIVVSIQPPSAALLWREWHAGQPGLYMPTTYGDQPERYPADFSVTESREEVTFVGAAPGAANGIADGRVTHTARRQWWTRQWAALWDLQWSIKPLSSIYDHQRCAARVTLSLFHCNDALWRQLQC